MSLVTFLPLVYVCLITFLLNIPFGYFRGKTRKFSVRWFLSIHIPIPLLIYTRHLFHVERTWQTLPIFVAFFFLGQFSGKMIYKYALARRNK